MSIGVNRHNFIQTMTTMNETRILECTDIFDNLQHNTEYYFNKIQIIDGVRVECLIKKGNTDNYNTRYLL